jgi:hypothetical protein
VESVSQRLDQVQTSKKFERLLECLDEFFAEKTNQERVLVFSR